ncbi:MAG: WecB/TagA/CpsF family glycosyltransferase [Candidatus Cloacimonetes bacterium]|nr:WecB/TagA/CpsF family glycosyltransferase [Candidatus Cloacimonadota bacterium]
MFRRIVEITVSILVLTSVTIPIAMIFFIRKLLTQKEVLTPEEIYNRNSDILTVQYFNTQYPFIRSLPLYIEVLKGEFGITGVSIRTPKDSAEGMLNAKPGILSIWLLRKLNKIDYEGRNAIDIEYLQNKSVKKDLMILIKSLLALTIKDTGEEYPDKINLLGISFLNRSMKDAVLMIEKVVSTGNKEAFYFMNPDCFNKLFVDLDYYQIMKSARNIFPDGSGVNMACKIMGSNLKQNINGTDMLPYLCRMAEEREFGLFLLGAKPGVAEKMKKNLEQKYPKIIICGTHDGYFDRETQSEEIVSEINMSGAKILLVAFGVPYQEKWIEKHISNLKVNVALGVGGLFDFYSGNMPRAPKWMRELGIEWLFRLYKEPKRMWRRYVIGNPLFIKRVKQWKKKIAG